MRKLSPQLDNLAEQNVSDVETNSEVTHVSRGTNGTTPNTDIQLPEEEVALRDREERRKQIAALSFLGKPVPPSKDAWRETVGMFENDPVYRHISELGRKIRNSE